MSFKPSKTWQLILVILVIVIAGITVLLPSFSHENISPVTPTPESKASRINPICISSHLNGLSQNDLNIQLNLMKKAGIKWTRFDFTMDVIEPAPGNFNWNYYDSLVNTAASYGVRIIALIDQYYTPPWANNSSDNLIPPSPAIYHSFTRAIAAHYTSKISLFEMGNEPNETGSWHPRWNVAAYTALLKAGYDGVKAGNPQAKVLSGGLSNESTTNGDASATVSFVQQMYANGAKGYFDYLALHPYSHSQGPDIQGSANFNVIPKVEALMKQEGDANKQIMVTEIGWTTVPGAVTETDQAVYISRVYTKIMHEDYQYVAIACIYDLVDGRNPQFGPDNFGVLNADYTPKPSFSSIEKAASDFSSHFTDVSP